MFKKIQLYTLLSATALTMGLAFTPITAQAQDNTYQWRTFNDVDVDRSGYIEGGEYQSYAFGMADWDNDGYLEETEWVSYTKNFYDDYDLDQDSITYVDSDGDGYIDFTEYNEYAVDEGLYDYWDLNNDNLIDDNDWDQVTAYYYDSE